MNILRRVVITGMGVVSPYGVGKDLFWDKLHNGVSAAKWVDSFDTSGMPVKFWANAPETDDELTGLLEKKRWRRH